MREGLTRYELIIDADDPGAMRRIAALAQREAAVGVTRIFVTDDPALPGLLRQTEQWERPAVVHFIGFRGEEYWSAVGIWGPPDFYHRSWDRRAQREIAEGDICIFAKGDPDRPSPYNHDDSNQDDDPAAKERLAGSR